MLFFHICKYFVKKILSVVFSLRYHVISHLRYYGITVLRYNGITTTINYQLLSVENEGVEEVVEELDLAAIAV